MMGFALMLAAAGIIVLIVGAAQAAQNRFYSTGSEKVLGTVNYMRRQKRRNGTAFELTVSYSVNGIAYSKVVGALPAEYEALKVGDEIELLCKTNNPKKAVRPMTLRPQNVRILLILGAVLLAAGMVLFFIGRM